MHKILIVDDDIDILEANRVYLKAKGYDVFTAENAKDALTEVSLNSFDCLILDVMLPDFDGVSLCKKIRKRTEAPIIFLSCKDTEDDKISGLLAGGDDYMTKPFSMNELWARIHAQIRRNSLLQGKLVIDQEHFVLMLEDKSVNLTPVEYNVFIFLYKNYESIMNYKQICAAIWSDESKDNDLRVYIKRLRVKLSSLGKLAGRIDTIYGKGYRYCFYQGEN